MGVAVDGKTVWVSDAASGGALGEVATGGPDPRDAGLAARDGQVWIANLGGTVGVVDTATGQPVCHGSSRPGRGRVTP